MSGGPWLEAARRIVERKGAEMQRPDGTWTTDWPEMPNELEERLGLNRWTPLEADRDPEPEGVLLDLFSASMLVQVHDALNPENRAKLEAMPLERAVDVGWRLVAKAKS